MFVWCMKMCPTRGWWLERKKAEGKRQKAES
jgi:hypothetical protein